jgi:uncharacterized protein YdcH (DUF465 family)
MSDHIPDVTKMISDTPRTDAEEYESQDEPITKLGSVDAEFARTLERHLNAANDRIKRLEDIISRASSRFFRDGSNGMVAIGMLNILEEVRKL